MHIKVTRVSTELKWDTESIVPNERRMSNVNAMVMHRNRERTSSLTQKLFFSAKIELLLSLTEYTRYSVSLKSENSSHLTPKAL